MVLSDERLVIGFGRTPASSANILNIVVNILTIAITHIHKFYLPFLVLKK